MRLQFKANAVFSNVCDCPARQIHRVRSSRTVQCHAAGAPSFGMFVCSASPEIAEAVGAAGVDWMCLDAQHGAVPYDKLKFMLCAAQGQAKKIVRVGGPTDRFGIQQALE